MVDSEPTPAKHGYARAQYELAKMYEAGRIGSPDATEAASWYLKAAKQELPGALEAIVRIDLSGGVVAAPEERQDTEDGTFSWVRSADQQYNLAGIFYEGEDELRDYERAFRWYMKAARQGRIEAYTRIGRMYLRGEGVDEDVIEAYWWLRYAAEPPSGFDDGNGEAAFLLGELYNSGSFEWRNVERAAYFWNIGSMQHNSDANFRLGQLLENGDVVDQNLEQARLFYRWAAEQGHEGARKRLEELDAE